MKYESVINKVLILAIIGMICAVVLIMFNHPVEGSVAQGNDYVSTSTRTALTGIPYSVTYALTGTTTQTAYGTLGSVVITGKNTGIVNIYDGTSTITNSQWGTTTLATFPANAPEGTYTFDLQFYRGLVVEVSSGLAPTSTITYRR